MELQWPLMIFTLFVCLGAGVFAVQGLLSLIGKGKEIQMPALIVAFASIVVGGIGSFLHLEHWERIFNGFGHLTSGITQELIGIAVFCAALVVYFFMLRKSEDGTLPKWCGAGALIISAALVVVMAHSYNMASKVVWDTPLLWLYYLSNAAFLGALAVAVLAGWKEGSAPAAFKPAPGAGVGTAVADAAFGEASVADAASAKVVGAEAKKAKAIVAAAPYCARLSGVLGLVNAIAVAVYTAFFMMAGSVFTDVGLYFDPVHPTKAMADPSAAFAGILSDPVFWLGAVLVGLIVPLVLAILAQKRSPGQIAAFCGIGLVCALAGGLCFRAILYMLGFSVFVFF